MAAGGSLTVLANGQTIVVNLTDADGSAPSATIAGSAVTWPYTLTDDTTFNIAKDGLFAISAKIGGVETVGRTYGFFGAEGVTLAPATNDYQQGSQLGNATSVLPDPTGKSGDYLTTDGTAVSWGTPPGAPVSSVAGKTGVVSLVKADVGLGNVDNTSDVNKPVSTAQAAADALALQKSNNLSDLANAATARTNLGLGSAATQASTAFDAAGAAAAVLPTQSGQSGKFLTTNGSAPSWGTPAGGSSTGQMTVINVKDATYGAVGDGTTDDSAAIQAAINAVNTTFGGVVYFPRGMYYVATGLTCTHPGTTFVGEATPGISDDLANGTTQIIVGNSQWGLTLGTLGTSDFRGYRVQDLSFFEKNTGQGAGGLRVYSSSNGSYVRVSAGRFTAGTGILFTANSGADCCQYNTLTDCRVGKCAIGYESQHTNGNRWIGGYAEGSHNGQTPAAGSIGFKITTGDTFRSVGTVFQGYDTLVQIGVSDSAYGAEIIGARFEVWTTAAVRVFGTAINVSVSGVGDNSLMSGAGAGIIIDSGAADTDVTGLSFRNCAQFVSDNGTRSRYGSLVGASRGANVLGNVIGRVAHYNAAGVLDGYMPLYDTLSGIYLVNKLGGGVVDTTTTTVTRTLATSVNVGDLVVVGGVYESATNRTVTITDSRGNTWTTDRVDDQPAGQSPHSFIAHCVVASGKALQAGDVITCTFSGSVSRASFYAYDYAGQAASPVDTTGGAIGNTSTAQPSTGNITTTSNYPLLFSTFCYRAVATGSAGSGFTQLDLQVMTSKDLLSESKIGPVAGTFVGATAGLTGSSEDWAISVVAFKAA